MRRAQQRLHFVRLLKKAGLRCQPLTQVYRGLAESILGCGITAWYGNTTVAERKSLQRVIETAERLISSELPSIDTIYSQRCRRRAQSIPQQLFPHRCEDGGKGHPGGEHVPHPSAHSKQHHCVQQILDVFVLWTNCQAAILCKELHLNILLIFL